MLRNRTLFWLIIIVFLAVLFFPAILPEKALANPGWYNASWQYRKKITINSANVSANLTDFPILVNLSSDTDLGADAQNDGDDILFTAADEVTKLSHEIESFNGTSGQLMAWVKIPALSSSVNTDIYMYYGNAGASNQENATAVWDSSFKMVQHLQESSGGANAIKDSTVNANHGTDNNTPTFGASGQIDGAISFDGTNDYIQVSDNTSLDISTSITLEAWVKPILDAEHRRIVIKPLPTWGVDPYYKYALWVVDTGLGFGFSDATTRHWAVHGPLADNVTQYVVGSYNGTHQQWYINGVNVGTETVTATIDTNDQDLLIGKAQGGTTEFEGIIDEVRISDTARSSDWILTSYNNQNSPSAFHTVGAEQSNTQFMPTLTTDNATLVEETTATLNGTLDNDGGEGCQYRFEYDTNSGTPYTFATSWSSGNITTGQSFSEAIASLNKGDVYYFRAQARNNAGTSSGSELTFLTKPDAPTSLSTTVIGAYQIDLSWTKGDGANRTMVRRKLGSYPASVTDGKEVYFDTGAGHSDAGLNSGTTYFYRAWSEVTGSQQFSDGYSSASDTTGGAPVAVGGNIFPISKASVLTPWLALFSFLLIGIWQLNRYL